jgi:Flp pilus assembly CpaE family ATPase
VTFVPEDRAACDDALLTGRTLAECAAQSPIRAAVRSLALTVAGERVGAPARPAARTWMPVRWRARLAR